MGKPIAIIFGAGKNIGAAVSTAFAAKGYRNVLVSRTIDNSNNEDEMSISTDLSHNGAVSDVFTKVRQSWGEPSLILYNAAAVHRVEPTNPFTVSEDDFAVDLTVNTISAYVAMKEAIVSFEALPKGQRKMFFYTANALASPGIILPRAFVLGVGKSATAHLIHVASESYKEAGYEFHLIDERMADGGPLRSAAGGESHAEFLSSLLEGKPGEVPWYASFTKGKGYIKV